MGLKSLGFGTSVKGVMPSTWSISYTLLALFSRVPSILVRLSFSDMPISLPQSTQTTTKRSLPVAGLMPRLRTGLDEGLPGRVAPAGSEGRLNHGAEPYLPSCLRLD